MQLEKVEIFKNLDVIYLIIYRDPATSQTFYKVRLLGLLCRRLKQLDAMLVSPHLEYAAALWDPHTSKDDTISWRTHRNLLSPIIGTLATKAFQR